MDPIILGTTAANVARKLKDILSGKVEDEVKDKIAKATKNHNLKKKIEERLEREKKALGDNSVESCFMFDSLSESVVNEVLNPKTLGLLLDVDKAVQNREKRRIYTQCAQDAAATSEPAKEKVKEIIDKCIQEVLGSISDDNKAAKDTVNVVNQHTDEAVTTINQGIKEASARVNRHTDEAATQTTDNVNQHIDEKLDELMTLILSHSQSVTVHETNLTSDNKEYLDLFNRKLFLESEDSNTTLQTMFIPPLVQNGSQKAEDCIVDWYQNNVAPFMILYGEAGIGKSSLVAKIISKACDASNTQDDPDKAPVLAVALRDHYELFSNLSGGYSARDVILKLFKAESINDLKGKLLILDGFDELTVLSSGFGEKEAETFINKLVISCKELRIMITSRDGYFDKKQLNESVVQEALCWKEDQVRDWCELYGRKNGQHEDWCRSFPKQYRNLPHNNDNDKRYLILCIPLILYLCCNSEVDISENKSIGKIYDQAFRQILLRAHGNELIGQERFINEPTDVKRRRVHWQYTKEIAYQMFLHDTLDLLDACDLNDKKCIGFVNAKERTKQVLAKKNIEIKGTDLHQQEYLAVFRFAKKSSSEGKAGITFVHKTVYEYFTALKLYEDYFAKFNKEYFEMHKKVNGEFSEEAIRKVMNSFIKAFRYKPIKKEDNIFQYLCEMVKPPFSGEDQTTGDKEQFDFEQYSQAFITGMKQHYLSSFDMPERIEMYNVPKYKNLPISAQLNLAFCNFTFFLTGWGFTNPGKGTNDSLADLISSHYMNVNLIEWNISHIDLKRVDLQGAILYGAYYSRATTHFPERFYPYEYGMIPID